MGKKLFLTEKPSVAMEFSKALKMNSAKRGDGYIEDDNYIITWCVGHLVAMSYPEEYDPDLKFWKLDTLPFIPDEWKYEIIKTVKKQFSVVKKQFTRSDVDTIYFSGDSGREGEYIGRLVLQMCGAKAQNKVLKRVWIDSQTEDEIKRGIRDAKPLSAYDNISKSAYLRAKEDYLMGINFSRALTLKYKPTLGAVLKEPKMVVSVGRVMTCVLAMVVERELEIKNFVKTPYYRVIMNADIGNGIELEWKAVENTKYFQSPLLYNEKGFKEEKDARQLIQSLPSEAMVHELIQKSEKKNAPLLFNLAELQNTCSKMFKISPDETLAVVQTLYENKLVTYPRTDARVLTTAISKEIHKNIKGIADNYPALSNISNYILQNGLHTGIASTKYTNDKQVTDHYAIIPTGQGYANLSKLSQLEQQIYDVITRRFLAIFLPPAIYENVSLTLNAGGEMFSIGTKVMRSKGYLGLYPNQGGAGDTDLYDSLAKLVQGTKVNVTGYDVKEGETKPPSRYNSGSMVLAMENAGQLIEDEALRAQIKGCGIGTSATRAETLKKLVNINYLALNKKTQILTPAPKGYAVYAAVKASVPQLLSPKLTASWEQGLQGVADGTISETEYWNKLISFIQNKIEQVKNINNAEQVKNYYWQIVKKS